MSPLPNSAHGDQLISAKPRGIDRVPADGEPRLLIRLCSARRRAGSGFGCAARAGARGADRRAGDSVGCEAVEQPA
jgi:hypothetical protein